MNRKHSGRIHVKNLTIGSIVWWHMGDFIWYYFPMFGKFLLYACVVFEIKKKVTLNVTKSLEYLK